VTGPRAPRPADKDIAAAYAAPLSLRAVAAKFGISREQARQSLDRSGTPVRDSGPLPVRGPGACAAAARRYLAGETTTSIGLDLGISAAEAGRLVRRAGVPLRSRSEAARARRAREAAERGEYPWAAEAARRHQAGEAVGRLAREYRAGPPAVQAAIERQGVTVTIRRYARQDAGGDAPPGGAT